ncbi:MAG: lytic transglycosylase domain-containing protein [Syntrophorhabdaceae bacterium]|nr:lytic transglycosylase domain-containing protein [Syntrophorhabdaceae bacterium]
MIYFRSLFIIAVLLWPVTGDAHIYKYVDSQGVVHFSTTKHNNKYNLYMKTDPPPSQRSPQGKRAGYDRNNWLGEYVRHYSKVHDISPELVHAIIKAESDGRRTAVSSKGAQGMMQLMPFTARQMDVKDPFDPIENVEGGIRYLKGLLVAFDGNVTKAVAAYNAGPNAVRRYGGVPPYKETREYVKRVLRYYRQYSSVE